MQCIFYITLIAYTLYLETVLSTIDLPLAPIPCLSRNSPAGMDTWAGMLSNPASAKSVTVSGKIERSLEDGLLRLQPITNGRETSINIWLLLILTYFDKHNFARFCTSTCTYMPDAFYEMPGYYLRLCKVLQSLPVCTRAYTQKVHGHVSPSGVLGSVEFSSQ